jgi:hypothetical protein
MDMGLPHVHSCQSAAGDPFLSPKVAGSAHTWLPACLPVCLSACLPICLSVRPSVSHLRRALPATPFGSSGATAGSSIENGPQDSRCSMRCSCCRV